MFHVLGRGRYLPGSGVNEVYLKVDLWNDYSFITLFDMSVFDQEGRLHEIGGVKIGFKGQTTSTPTYESLPLSFDRLDQRFFSLGQSVEFYKRLATLPPELKGSILVGLRDIVASPEIVDQVEGEKVFATSLMRSVSLSSIRGQFARVLRGLAERTDFRFRFRRDPSERVGPISLDFDVEALSTPSTNVHAIIGRNGVGKTTLLNSMIGAIVGQQTDAHFFDRTLWGDSSISKDYFSSVVSVSFSAFDPFEPPQEQPDPSKGTCYFYIGLKSQADRRQNRTIDELHRDCARNLADCFASREKASRWRRAIEQLGSDEIFASMALEQLAEIYDQARSEANLQSDSPFPSGRFFSLVQPFLRRMSSGHAVVLLTVTYLVARVEEKTLVLLDEPESHLHPPLLSAFIRALSDLLHDRNGVAVIATHSPVVLQEIPRSCVWKIGRYGLSVTASRPEVETFGENVGILTSEVFGLEVERSGFHALLARDVGAGKSYDQIIAGYSGQLGVEGRAILGALIANRKSGNLNAPPH